MPKDALLTDICKQMMIPGATRDRLSKLCYISDKEDDAIGIVERAFLAMYDAREIEAKLKKAQKAGDLPAKMPMMQVLDMAQDNGVISEHEAEQLLNADKLRREAIAVDEFTPEEIAGLAKVQREHAA